MRLTTSAMMALALATLVALPMAATPSVVAAEPETAALDKQIAQKRAEIAAAPLDAQAGLSETLLPLVQRRFGEVSPEYAQALESYAMTLGFARRGPDAQRTMEQVVALWERITGPDSFAAGEASQRYALTLMGNGFKAEAARPYRRYVDAITEEAFGCGRVKQVPGGRMIVGCVRGDDSLGEALNGYGQLLHDLGRSDEGIALFRATIARFEPRWAACETAEWGMKCDRAASDRRTMIGNFAALLSFLGRHEEAIAIRRDIALPRLEALATCTADACRADYWLLGDFATWKAATDHFDAAAARQLGYRWFPVLAAEPIYVRGADAKADYFDARYRELLDGLLKGLAEDAVKAGERDRALALLTPLGKADFLGSAQAAEDFDAELAALGKRGEALGYDDYDARASLLREKADIYRRQYGPASREYGGVLREVGTELANLDDDAATEAAFRDAFAIVRAAEGDDGFATWITLSYLSDWLAREQRPADAIAALGDLLRRPANDKSDIYADPVKSRLLTSGLGMLNDPHGPLNELYFDYAALLLRTDGDPQEALRAARHAATGKRAWRSGFGFSRTDEIILADEDNRYIFGQHSLADYQLLHADALWAAGARDAGAAEIAFSALQEVQLGTASKAVAKAAAERTLSRAGVSGLLDERRAIDIQIDAVQGERPPPDALSGDAYRGWSTDNLARQRRLEFRRDEIDRAIGAAAPGYFEYVRPRPLSLAEAQALLAPDQAMLMIVPTDFGTHSLFVTKAGLRWHRSDLTRESLTPHVRRLLWDVGATIDVTPEEDAKWAAEGEGDFPFDRSTAYLLYRELVAPFANDLSGKRHLFTATSGMLSSLPLGILVTAPPQGADGDPDALRATPWLADAAAIVQLPSLQSLQLLRAVAASPAAGTRGQLIGFGNPALDGPPATRGARGRDRSATRSAALPVGAGLQFPDGDGPPLADPATLRQLARLPGTETELRAMEALLGKQMTRLYLGNEATETRIKGADLDNLSVLFLATHGLIAGDISGLAEPGLVLTPPVKASARDDGLLTASEIARMSIAARWVILSACNTAAGDGRAGAPGLSGLARAFFFAGSESLLASHWPVRDDVASVMTVKLFEILRDNPDISRAEALQRAERAIRDDRRSDAFVSSWSHPSAWAPFSLIGDAIR